LISVSAIPVLVVVHESLWVTNIVRKRDIGEESFDEEEEA
jgi:hypothetical protein